MVKTPYRSILCALIPALVAFSVGVRAAIAEDRSSLIAAVGGADKLREKRQALAKDIAKLAGEETEKPADEEGKASKDSEERLAELRATDAVYARQQTLLDQRQQLEAQVKEAERELEALDTFEPDEPKPYSFLLQESLRDQVAAEEEREAAISADLKAAKQLLETAHEELDDWQKDRTQANKKEQQTDREGAANDKAASEAAGQLAKARIALRQTEIEVQQLQLDLCQTRQKQIEKKLKVVKKDAEFSAQDRDHQLERLAGLEADAKRRRGQIERKFQLTESEQAAELLALREKSAAQPQLDAANDAWRVAREAYQAQIVILDQRIEDLATVRRYWKRRYEVASGHPEAKDVAKWLEETGDFLKQLTNETRSLEHRRDSARGDETPAGNQADEASSPQREFRNARLLELRDLCESRLGEIKSFERTLDRFQDELKARLKAAPGDWGSNLEHSLQSFVDYEVIDADDESVTIGRLLVLSLYIVGGLLLAYALSRLIGGRMLSPLGLHPGTATALRSIMFYSLCVFFGVLAFQMLRIPLGAFAFLGGAAAIAIGFGSQDIMNNFMSGIILLMEQPIRVGDVIELSGTQAVVTRIGLRSTRLLTEANHELIVANSTLLEKQVTNLTLTDEFVRTVVTLELDRTEDIERVKRRMLEIAFSHTMVMKSPRPVVLLKEVDCYSLRFEVHVWMEHRSFMKCAMVQSEILEAVTLSFPPPDETSESAPAADAAAQPDEANGAAKDGQANAVRPSTGSRASSRQLMAALRHMGSSALAKR